jgi:hypothetical protein
MTDCYGVCSDSAGWTVVDLGSGAPAVVDDGTLVGLAFEEAVEIGELLRSIDLLRRDLRNAIHASGVKTRSRPPMIQEHATQKHTPL